MVLRPAWLPEKVFHAKWGVPERVKELMRERVAKLPPDDKLTIFDVGGPAVWWAWVAFGAFWIIHLPFPFFVFGVSSCPSQARKPLEAATPWWIWPAVVASVLVAVRAALRSLMIVVVPLLQWLTRFKLPMLESPWFTVWLLASTTQSILSCLSTASTGVFVGSAWRRRSCGDSHVELPVHLTEQGHAHWHLPTTLVDAMLIATFATMCLRVLFSILLALPVRAFCCDRVDFGFKGEKDGYRVLIGWNLWHADVLKVLADGTNMTFLSKPLSDQQFERAQVEVKTDPARCFQILLQQMRREGSMYFLHAVLSAVQLAIQSVLFAWGRAVFHALHNPGSPGDDSVVLSIILGTLTAMTNMYGASMKLRSTWRVAGSVDWETAAEKAALAKVKKSTKDNTPERDAALAEALPVASADLRWHWRAIAGHSCFMTILIMASFAIVAHSVLLVGQAVRCEGSVNIWSNMCVKHNLASKGTDVKYV